MFQKPSLSPPPQQNRVQSQLLLVIIYAYINLINNCSLQKMVLGLSYKIMQEIFQNSVFKNPHVTYIICIIHTSKNLKKNSEMNSLEPSLVGLNAICKLRGLILYKGENSNDFFVSLIFSKEISKSLYFYR